VSHWRRIQYSVVGTLVNGVQAIIYFRLFEAEFVAMATGDFSGPFTEHIHTISTLWAAEIVVIQVALLLYLLWGPVREQRAVEEVPYR